MSRIERDLLAIADSINTASWDSRRYERALHRSSTLSAESHVVLNRYTLVGVSLKGYLNARLLLQSSRVRLKIGSSLVIEGVGIETEVYILEHPLTLSGWDGAAAEPALALSFKLGLRELSVAAS